MKDNKQDARIALFRTDPASLVRVQDVRVRLSESYCQRCIYGLGKHDPKCPQAAPLFARETTMKVKP